MVFDIGNIAILASADYSSAIVEEIDSIDPSTGGSHAQVALNLGLLGN